MTKLFQPTQKQISNSNLHFFEIFLKISRQKKFKDYLAVDATIINVSTTYIDEKPEGFAHYYEAKKAIENDLKKFSKNFPKLTILNFRLPKMLTDQTNSNIASNAVISPVKVVDIVIRDYIAKRNLKGFHSLVCNLKKHFKEKVK